MVEKGKIPRFLPGLQSILFLSIFSAAILLGPRMLNMDGDLPRHLAIGKYVLAGHFPPITDIFSHTRFGTPFAPHKWLSGVFFYLAYLLFDERGIVILSATLLAGTFTIIYADGVRRYGIRMVLFPLVAGGAAVSSLHWIARPHLFTMFFLAIWLVWSERLASGKNIPLWYFPALMLVWNNVHGEFISGFLVIFACLVGWIWDYLFNRQEADIATGKRLGIVLVMIMIVTVLNPVSFRAWGTVTSWMGNEYLMERTQETVSPNFLSPAFLVLLGFLSAAIFLLAMNRSKLPTRMALLLAGFTLLTLQSARNVHLYGVVAPFVLAGTLTGTRSFSIIIPFENLFAGFEDRFYDVVWPALTIFLGILVLCIPAVGKFQKFSPSFFPVQAVEWLNSHPQEGEMFNPFDWGGYISFMMWPEERVYIDSQGDIYGEAFLREYEQVITLKTGWQDILNKYKVDWAIIPGSWPLARALEQEGWQVQYFDKTTVILRRGGQASWNTK
jgi:hypothetical protein